MRERGRKILGGLLSGGGRFAPRTSAFWRLDIAKLKELGFLRPGPSRLLSWYSNGERRASIGVAWAPECLTLDYSVRERGGEWEPVRDRIPLTYTFPNYGGERAWFVCPSCGRRRRVLYGSNYYRCRECRRAVYASQYEPAYGRPINRALKIRERLGITSRRVV